MSDWQPIETAPKDGTKIIVLLNMATVWVAHIAWWRNFEEAEEDPDLVGWWSYVRHSVTQEMLRGHHAPLYWIPLEEPKGYLWGMKLGPHHPSVANARRS